MRFLVPIAFALIPALAFAQSFDSVVNAGPPLSIDLFPSYPVPMGTALVSVNSGKIDLNTATLTLKVNGTTVYQGTVKPVSVSMGKAGETVRISATISAEGATYSETVAVIPQDVSLVIEPLASAPPLYAGKPSVPFEGSVRMVAIANLKSASGTLLDPNLLSYVWNVDGTEIANASGIGKQTLVVASPLQYRSRSVSVVVTSQDKTVVGGADTTLSPREASVRIYENDPLLGIRFERALPSYTITSAEVSFFGAAFSLPLVKGSLGMKWFLNNELAQEGNTITLRPTGGGEGRASLSFTTTSGEGGTATGQLPLMFGSHSSFFGL